MTPLELTIMIIIGVSIFLLAAWITYVTRLLHKTRNQLSQAFNAINSLLSNDSVKTPEQNQSPLGRLHQYKGYVIKVIQDGGGFKGIIYDNSMKKTITTTAFWPTQSETLAVAKALIDLLVNPIKEIKEDD